MLPCNVISILWKDAPSSGWKWRRKHYGNYRRVAFVVWITAGEIKWAILRYHCNSSKRNNVWKLTLPYTGWYTKGVSRSRKPTHGNMRRKMEIEITVRMSCCREGQRGWGTTKDVKATYRMSGRYYGSVRRWYNVCQININNGQLRPGQSGYPSPVLTSNVLTCWHSRMGGLQDVENLRIHWNSSKIKQQWMTQCLHTGSNTSSSSNANTRSSSWEPMVVGTTWVRS